jgi:hypothetical protein
MTGVSAVEAASAGVNRSAFAAPMVDVSRDPRWTGCPRLGPGPRCSRRPTRATAGWIQSCAREGRPVRRGHDRTRHRRLGVIAGRPGGHRAQVFAILVGPRPDDLTVLTLTVHDVETVRTRRLDSPRVRRPPRPGGDVPLHRARRTHPGALGSPPRLRGAVRPARLPEVDVTDIRIDGPHGGIPARSTCVPAGRLQAQRYSRGCTGRLPRRRPRHAVGRPATSPATGTWPCYPSAISWPATESTTRSRGRGHGRRRVGSSAERPLGRPR